MGSCKDNSYSAGFEDCEKRYLLYIKKNIIEKLAVLTTKSAEEARVGLCALYEKLSDFFDKDIGVD